MTLRSGERRPRPKNIPARRRASSLCLPRASLEVQLALVIYRLYLPSQVGIVIPSNICRDPAGSHWPPSLPSHVDVVISSNTCRDPAGSHWFPSLSSQVRPNGEALNWANLLTALPLQAHLVGTARGLATPVTNTKWLTAIAWQSSIRLCPISATLAEYPPPQT